MFQHPKRGIVSFDRILVVRTDRLGDVILTLPVCAELHRSHPGISVAMMVRRYVGPIVTGNRLVDEVLWYDDASGNPRPLDEIVSDLRARRFDAAVAVHPTPRIAWMLARAGVPVRVGTGYRLYSPLFTHRVYDHRRSGERHELEYNLRLLTALGIPSGMVETPLDFGISPSAASRTAISRILQSLGVSPGADLVVLHPGSGGSSREWLPERFRELGLNLSRMRNVRVVVTGTPAEERVLLRVVSDARPEIVSLAGMLRMDQLSALLERASLVVANSTGPLHLAVALGTPVIGLYPPIAAMSPRRWGPYGDRTLVIAGEGPVNCRKCAGGGQCGCMLTISVERVTGEAVRLLQQVRSTRGSSVA